MSNKFLIHGAEVEVVAQFEGGYLVRDIYESNDGEGTYSSGVRFQSEPLFDSPPTQKINEEVDKLQAKLSELRNEKSALEISMRNAVKLNVELMAKLTKTEQLKHLADFIDGNLNYYVQNQYHGVTVVDFKKEGISEYPLRKGELKLITLFGMSNGNLQWRIHQYSDGSGMKYDIFPCTTLEAASILAKQLVIENADNTNERPRAEVIRDAKLFQVDLPEGYEAKYNQNRIAEIQNSLSNHLSQAETLRAEMAKFQ